ncbi:hypothetical protein [Haloferula sp. BvORR071]|uniref:hypothetical protein n=1 Tax=Haloferula sp. BvORR071 TaxID=1396141 RepID=UPI00054D99B9|nr:hypothetical protein [Haloferula sp. BvORR071]
MASRNLTLIGAVAVASAGAFFAGRMTAPAGAAASGGGQNGALSGKAASRSAGGEQDGAAGRREGAAGRDASRKDGGASNRGEKAIAKMHDLMLVTDPMARSKAWLDFLNTVDPSEFESVVADFRGSGMTDTRMSEYSMLLTAWAKRDPLQALAYAEEHTGNRFARNTILTSWAASDPDAALQWAKEHHKDQEGEGNPWLIGVIQGIAASDPVRASQLLVGMPFSEERGEALGALMPHLLAQGADAAHKWAESITDEQLKQGAIGRVAEALAEKDPEGTAAWLARNPGEASDRSMDNVISTWMEKDKDAAVAYYKGLPSGDMRTSALRGVANSMAMQDPRAAADFLDANAVDANDGVYQQFAWHSFGQAPDLAANYIGKMTDPREQERMYGRMLDGWLRRDFDSASKWINGNSLPQPVMDRLQKRMQEQQQRQQ